ncbi:MAG: peptidase [Gammaproteobacteria bacterium]|nr:peptidase [Pseudomonadota bacterium]MCC6630788.1 peptidase [Gammaproteobacteria bacterium]
MSSSHKIRSLSVGAAVLMALAACQKAPEQKAEAAPAFKLDESALIQPIRFTAADIDATKSACTDLAAYANDKWLAANPIPADQTRWGAFNVLRERSLQVQKQLAEQIAARPEQAGIDKIIADLWATGTDATKRNADGIAPLESRLAEIAALKDGAGIAEYLRKVAARGENPLFGFGSEADFKNSSMKIAYAVQGGTSLPDKTYYFDADKKAIREAFVAHVAKVLELSGVPAADAATQAKQVMAFETRLAKASKSQEDLSRDVSLYYNPVSVADADKLTPNFSWTAFLESQPVAKPEMFSLSVPSFHQEVSKMLMDVPVAEWQTYLRFRTVDGAAPFLSDALVAEQFNFYSKTLSGQKEMKDLWKRVLAQMEGAAGEALGQAYVQVAFPPESRDRMQKLVDNLREALKGRIETLSWMTPATKTKALEKWGTFTAKIGYPTKWRDWTGLETSRDSYFQNMVKASEFNYRYDLTKVGKPTDKTEWGMTPQTVNAYYNPLQNEIVFPAAILQPPFFDPQADDALNYGAIGVVIGHELTHGYDDQGARFGASGNFEQWWTPEDAKKFEALTGALAKQYDGYTLLGDKVNGKLTLGENIADLGGINIAYDALQRASKDVADPKIDNLTRDQRFFLGFAAVWRDQIRPEALKVQLASDPHSPGRIRANGTPTNVPAYAAAFGCKAGDAMVNPEAKRVVIW